jgi:hypothetical protein
MNGSAIGDSASSEATKRGSGASRSEGPVGKSSYFPGDPPPDPRFLASLGALSLVELGHCSGWTGPKEPATMSSLGISYR